MNKIRLRVKKMQGHQGFTLLETLVALAILAIAMAAVMRATGAGINHTEAMRIRVLADWVAQNRLALHAARGDFISPGIQNGEETQAGVRLLWKEDVGITPNPAFRRIEVSVFAPEDPEYALRKVSGFLVQQRR
jgi:general secretion pathway protein I